MDVVEIMLARDLGAGRSVVHDGLIRIVGSAHWAEVRPGQAWVTLCFTDGTEWLGHERTGFVLS